MFLRIRKYIDEYTMRDLVDVQPKRGTAEQMTARLRRIFGEDRVYEPGAVVIELYDDEEDLTDDCAVVPPSGAEWLLVDFFKVRKAWSAYRRAGKPTANRS